ncbi:MAG: glycoside hydrolase family 127 protein [Chloroflexi bacterium]|nr:glycoside hydrolase family 127 protein [Chloroflexota bacterium]
MRTSENRPSPLPWTAVEIDGGFWGDRQRINRDHTMPAVYHQCKITGRIDAWNPQRDPNLPESHIFWDSDVAKWIEAVGYSVALHPNAEFERQVDEIVDWMEQMQLADGYANSHFIAVEPENRWRNLRDQHELYCAGHLIEAAIVYAQVTGKRKILDILCRYADHIAVTFGRGDGQKRGYPGHPELELALMRLYQATDEPRYRDLAQYFVDERGQAPHYYDLEAIERGEDPRGFWARSYHYCQAHAPIREQTGMVGHSVRACYLYTGTTDLALETGDAELTEVAHRLWDDLTGRHMYVTGGVGSIHTIEGFTVPFDLPNDTAYSETCSAIALCYWSQRMFSLDPHRRYIDAIERALYNCILSGVAYDGETFFQCNPLEAYPHISPYALLDSMSAPTHHRRVDWFDVSCCPPNLVRMVASVGGYFYATTPNRLYVHLYNQNTARLTVGANEVHITQATDYPWDGGINFTLELAKPTRFELALRIPGWCREYAITVNGAAITVELDKGYAVLDREWRAGDQVTLMLAMPIERIAAHPHIRADVGCVALQRGPLVYCLEEADNGAGLAHLRLPRTNALNYAFDADLFGGVGTITGEALRGESAQWCGELYAPAANLDFTQTSITLRAIPYCFWANRQPGEMRVWIRET